ncbi:zinc finger MYM-type protein 1-like [Aphis craccivora]|uniref:Zinc finger MYM-type protein 1-like n=1 Tax=Aphis craccivora TaxID=307492 RepID=A0A6G0WG67_APHCR|nr:zinc finger MYM-type protein 1-like [Aphis craccivora]
MKFPFSTLTLSNYARSGSVDRKSNIQRSTTMKGYFNSLNKKKSGNTALCGNEKTFLSDQYDSWLNLIQYYTTYYTLKDTKSFLGFYPLHKHGAEDHGQGYDGASVMSGSSLGFKK